MSAVLTDLTYPPPAWRRPALALGLLMLGILLLYLDTGITMVGIWSRSDTFAHAFLVPPISAWLIWRGRDRLVGLSPRPALIWLVPLALAALVWFLGDLVSVNAVTQFTLVFMLVVSVPLVLGWPATRAMLFPLLFLFFCVPVGEFLLPMLMEATADFTVAALRFSGIPVYREGLQFVIPSGHWSVVEACSGVRYLIASLMVGSLFAYLNYQSMGRRLIFVGVSIVVPILANWIRAYIIVMLGHLSNNRIATGVDHLVYGWVFFGVVITIMFMIGARWAEPDRALVPRDPTLPAASASGLGAGLYVAVPVALAVLALPTLAAMVLHQQVTQGAVQLVGPASGTAGWSAAPAPEDWRPKFESASARQDFAYRRDGQTVGVHVAYYRGQGPDRKLVSSQNMLVSSMDPIWNSVGSTRHEVTIDGTPMAWRQTHLIGRTGNAGSLSKHYTVWQAYWVDGQLVAGDIQAKLRGAQGLLAGRGDDSAAVLLYVAADPVQGAAVLQEFSAANLPALLKGLEQARQAR